ncbi:carboxylesterase family protein-like protein [Westerdykella ornata]|uniref:Carboxylic ester hydrolase n=1 Tax=Westerdykella ornata TaxID=318751 RepID=A0A6A6JQU6_WESOR|nr:carboxylesterase family protein-like protein [Westerdykella ornata]KAF2278473.1 carboxylesterase family protein-like protein [Westerdykella ornata]
MRRIAVTAAASLLLGASGVFAEQNATLPKVDLGYQIQQASGFNETGRFYNFSNIRYAAPPVGKLRFALPQAPAENRSVVNTGSEGRICPQASPAWGAAAVSSLTTSLLGLPTNGTPPFVPPKVNWSTPLPPQDPRTSEDCLFLDVFVPEDVFATANKSCGAPVLVWIYGGGYTSGNKYENPAGLLAASGNVSNGNVIYVAMNYRLGAMGFSSGPSFQAEGGVSNVGLHDQRFALEWIQKYIHLFGGDPRRVTVFGESAGGGSIMHQITAYGGSKGPVPFAQAVPQSPGWDPVSSQLQQEDTYRQLLNLTNSTSLSDLRALSSADIIKASFLQVYSAPWGSYGYGPVVDGSFVPQQPGQLLAQGRFDQSLRIMVGHNADEGAYFTPPYINSTADVANSLRSAFPYIPPPSLTHITDVLYPEPAAVPNGLYTTHYERSRLLVSDAIFTCNTFYLSRAPFNATYSYLFSVPPALHGQDVAYTYYEGGAPSSSPFGVRNITVALALQEFITSFAIEGKPKAEGVREFRMYGDDARVLELNVTGIEELVDPNANERCRWWQLGLYS